MDYKNGKIYKIVNDINDDIYIGSTCQSLSKRLAKHRAHHKDYLAGKGRYMTSFKILDTNCYDIILIEKFECESKEELHKREGELIREHKDNAVNKCIIGRTRKEYREDEKDKIKKYYQDNKETISQKKKEYYDTNRKEHNNKIKIYRANNKEMISKKQGIKHNCECGGKYTCSNKSQHQKSKKHQIYINNIII